MSPTNDAHSGALKRIADSLSGFDDPSMGDERQREVILRAYTFAMQLGLFLSFAVALLLAVVGLGFASLAVVVVAGTSSWAAVWYCARENVSMPMLVNRANPRRKRLTLFVTGAFVIAWVAARSFHVLTGAPLLSVDSDRGVGEASTVVGMLVGGGLAAVVVILAMKRAEKRATRKEMDEG